MVREVGGCGCYPCRTALHPAATPKATPSSTTTPLPVSPYQRIAYCSLYTPILTRYLGMTWLGTLDGKMQAPQRVLWPCVKALKPGSRLGPGINRIPFSIAQEHLSFSSEANPQTDLLIWLGARPGKYGQMLSFCYGGCALKNLLCAYQPNPSRPFQHPPPRK
jgi:hypothetical protein